MNSKYSWESIVNPAQHCSAVGILQEAFVKWAINQNTDRWILPLRYKGRCCPVLQPNPKSFNQLWETNDQKSSNVGRKLLCWPSLYQHHESLSSKNILSWSPRSLKVGNELQKSAITLFFIYWALIRTTQCQRPKQTTWCQESQRNAKWTGAPNTRASRRQWRTASWLKYASN